MVIAQRLLTADEFDCLPEPESGGKMELDDGVLVVQMPVNPEHGRLQLLIGGPVMAFVDKHKLGLTFVETGYRLRDSGAPHRVKAPDVSFLAAENLPTDPGWRKRGSVRRPPDLAVEVLSPDDRPGAVARKVGQYLEAGSARVWVVDPDERLVIVYRPDAGPVTLQTGDTLTSDHAGFLVDGFALPLAQLFPAD